MKPMTNTFDMTRTHSIFMHHKISRSVYLSTVVIGLLLACSLPTGALPAWDLGSDFSTTNGNPNILAAPRAGSSWIYGHMAPTGFVPDPTYFTPFPHANGDFDTSTGLESWNIDGGDPNVRHNPTGDPINCCGGAITWQPNGVTFSPWGSSATGVRWTAPAAGAYAITATFTDVQGISEPVYVYSGTALLFQSETGEPTGSSVAFSDTIVVQSAGDTLDFVATGPYNVGAQITISNTSNNLVWDLGSDFSTSNGNPNNLASDRAGSSWIYGTYATVIVSASMLQPFSHTNGIFDTNLGLESWNLGGDDPNVRHNPTSNSISSGDTTWLANSVTFSESGSLGLVGATWSAPSKGVYSVVAKFKDLRGNSEPVYVRHNSAQLFRGETGIGIGSSVSYSNSITIAGAGETLFFLTGGGTNDVEAQVTITQTSSELPRELLVWNLGDDFSTLGGNPNQLFGLRAGSSWAYGTYGAVVYENVIGFTAFTNVNGGFDAGLGTESWHFADGDPNVRHNPTAVPVTCCGGLITWPPNEVSFSPAGSGGKSGGAGVQWVAPSVGTYQVVVTYKTVQGDSPVPVFVAHGTKLLFQDQTGATNGASVTYSNRLAISSGGETLSFFAQNANNALAQITITNTANGLGWDLASDFSVVNGNPNALSGDRTGSSWAYGTFTVVTRPDSSTFDIFREVNGGFDESLGLESWNVGGGDPNVRHNPTSAEVSCCGGAVTWLPNGVNFSPAGSPQSMVGARWSAPSAGIYEILATFSDRQNVSLPVFVLHGNALIYADWTGTPMGSSVTHSNLIWVAGAGETLDFASGGNQNTGAQIMITRTTLSPLTISQQGGQIIIEWLGVGTLQRTSELTGSWEDVTGAESPFIISAPTANQYYRLKL